MCDPTSYQTLSSGEYIGGPEMVGWLVETALIRKFPTIATCIHSRFFFLPHPTINYYHIGDIFIAKGVVLFSVFDLVVDRDVYLLPYSIYRDSC